MSRSNQYYSQNSNNIYRNNQSYSQSNNNNISRNNNQSYYSPISLFHSYYLQNNHNNHTNSQSNYNNTKRPTIPSPRSPTRLTQERNNARLERLNYEAYTNESDQQQYDQRQRPPPKPTTLEYTPYVTRFRLATEKAGLNYDDNIGDDVDVISDDELFDLTQETIAPIQDESAFNDLQEIEAQTGVKLDFIGRQLNPGYYANQDNADDSNNNNDDNTNKQQLSNDTNNDNKKNAPPVRDRSKLPLLPPLIPVSQLTDEQFDELIESYGLIGDREDIEGFVKVLATLENQQRIERMNFLPDAMLQILSGKTADDLMIEDITMYDKYLNKNGEIDDEVLDKLIDEFDHQVESKPNRPLSEIVSILDGTYDYNNDSNQVSNHQSNNTTTKSPQTTSKSSQTTKNTTQSPPTQLKTSQSTSFREESKMYDDIIAKINEFNKDYYKPDPSVYYDPKTGKPDKERAARKIVTASAFGDPIPPLPEELLPDPNDVKLFNNSTPETAERLDMILQLAEKQRHELNRTLRESISEGSQEYIDFQRFQAEFDEREKKLKERMSLQEETRNIFDTLASRRDEITGHPRKRFPLPNEPVPFDDDDDDNDGLHDFADDDNDDDDDGFGSDDDIIASTGFRFNSIL